MWECLARNTPHCLMYLSISLSRYIASLCLFLSSNIQPVLDYHKPIRTHLLDALLIPLLNPDLAHTSQTVPLCPIFAQTPNVFRWLRKDVSGRSHPYRSLQSVRPSVQPTLTLHHRPFPPKLL
ncbi:hypothetical protein IGI04_036681 [Brassica rapa subsp. trilocularis]|uniref:Uncharacterized protein n=1 Tax=Brassica rapa subsp. trilocularis TaxID=1813537 RepID=A0ABQ7LHF0_BRACM|nr:hypothetical protein IGI04_042240 [Brassica rapa subsp. trilocularis]KAG5385211.1 hypothetical protein IGI04_036681 [Brassica rapa subsp. trilocularis]